MSDRRSSSNYETEYIIIDDQLIDNSARLGLESGFVNLNETDKRKPYFDNNYRDAIATKFPGVEFTDKMLENYYRKMYKENCNNQLYSWNYQRVFYHPDIATYDYEFLEDKIHQVPYKIFASQIGCMAGIGWVYWKTTVGRTTMRNNQFRTGVLFATLPFVTLGGTWYFIHQSIENKVFSLQLDEKYRVHQYQN